MPMHNPPHPGEFIREVYLIADSAVENQSLSTAKSVESICSSRIMPLTLARNLYREPIGPTEYALASLQARQGPY